MKKEKTPTFVIVAALTTITTVFWVMLSVYLHFTKSEPYKVPEAVLEPVNPTLDSDTLLKLDQRVYIPENELPETIVVAPQAESENRVSTPRPTALPREENEATGSAEENQ